MSEPTPEQRAEARTILAGLLPHLTAVANVECIAALIAERDDWRRRYDVIVEEYALCRKYLMERTADLAAARAALAPLPEKAP